MSAPQGMEALRRVRALRFASTLGPITVRGASMAPLLRAGSVVSVRARTPRIGDVVVFHSPAHGMVVHRVVGRLRIGGMSQLLTRGDNARALDAPVPLSMVVGVVAGVDGKPLVVRTRDRARAALSVPAAVAHRIWRRLHAASAK